MEKEEKYFRVIIETADVDDDSNYNYKDRALWETGYPDIDIDNIIQGFIGCMRSIGYAEKSIYDAMEAECRSMHRLKEHAVGEVSKP